MSQLSFTDAKGRTWSPRVDCRVVMEFERKAGIGVFDTVFSVLQDVKSGKPEEHVRTITMKMTSAFFGRLSNLMLLLFESCRPLGKPDSNPEWNGESASYADFCAAIEREQLGDAISVAIQSLFEFFPEVDGADSKAQGDKSDDPFAALRGRMSSKTQ